MKTVSPNTSTLQLPSTAPSVTLGLPVKPRSLSGLKVPILWITLRPFPTTLNCVLMACFIDSVISVRVEFLSRSNSCSYSTYLHFLVYDMRLDDLNLNVTSGGVRLGVTQCSLNVFPRFLKVN